MIKPTFIQYVTVHFYLYNLLILELTLIFKITNLKKLTLSGHSEFAVNALVHTDDKLDLEVPFFSMLLLFVLISIQVIAYFNNLKN